MKALCLALVLLNVMYFAWAQWHTEDEAPAAPPVANEVPTLVLAREAGVEGEEGSAAPAPTEEARPAAHATSPDSGTSAQASETGSAPVVASSPPGDQHTGGTPAPTEALAPEPDLLTEVQRCL